MNRSDDIDLQTQRLIDRLETMTLSRIDDDVIALVHEAAERIVALTDDPDRPAAAALPVVGSTAIAAQLRIVVDDYRRMRFRPQTTMAASEDAAIIQILKELRGSLP